MILQKVTSHAENASHENSYYYSEAQNSKAPSTNTTPKMPIVPFALTHQQSGITRLWKKSKNIKVRNQNKEIWKKKVM
jgi:hypothetical protein